jgi:hypothetical protein
VSPWALLPNPPRPRPRRRPRPFPGAASKPPLPATFRDSLRQPTDHDDEDDLEPEVC